MAIIGKPFYLRNGFVNSESVQIDKVVVSETMVGPARAISYPSTPFQTLRFSLTSTYPTS
jgi:hypothetical protein